MKLLVFSNTGFFPFFLPQAILIKATGISKQILSDVCVCLPHFQHPHILQASPSQIDGISGEKTELLSSEIPSPVVCDKICLSPLLLRPSELNGLN